MALRFALPVVIGSTVASALPVSLDVYAGAVTGNPPATFTNLGNGGVGPNGTRVGVASAVSASRVAAGTSNAPMWTIPGPGTYRVSYHLDNTVNADFRPGIQGFYNASPGVANSPSEVADALNSFLALPGVSATTDPEQIPSSLNSGSGGVGAPAVPFSTTYIIEAGSPAIGMEVAIGFHSTWNAPGAYIFGREDGPNHVLIEEAIPPPPEVLILPENEFISPGQWITLVPSIENAQVYFTLDGTTPDTGATLYTGPFPLTTSTTVKAVAFDANDNAGPVAERSYTLQEPVGTPNLLVIVGDSVGFGDLHCNGGVNIATPALDSLAYDGIRFTQFTTTGGGGAAAQYALLTGRTAARSGMAGQPATAGAIGWNAEEWTLAKMLRRAGYHTAFIGEWLLGDAAGSHPNDQGFQLFHGLPHAFAQNPPLAENRDILTANPDPDGLLDALTQRTVDHIAASAPSAEPFAIVFHPPALPATGSSLAGPHGNRIEALDQSVAQLLTALDSHDLADDTLVIFLGNGGAPRTTDGGSNGIFRDGAGTTWEGGLRSPMLARFPGTLPAGQMNLSLIWLPDVMPTIGTITGGQLAGDRPLDGMPRAAALTGTQTRPAGDETVFGLRHHNGSWQIATVRQGKWKSHLAITNIDPENNRPTTGNQLYDLHVDAEERINRASGQPATLNDLAAIATAAANSLPATGQTDLPAPKEPLEGGVSTLIESNGTTTMRYSFIRPADSIDDFYQIEHSSDLSQWHPMAIGPFVEGVVPLGGQREQLELAVPLGSPPLDGSRRFIRLTADRPSHD